MLLGRRDYLLWAGGGRRAERNERRSMNKRRPNDQNISPANVPHDVQPRNADAYLLVHRKPGTGNSTQHRITSTTKHEHSSSTPRHSMMQFVPSEPVDTKHVIAELMRAHPPQITFCWVDKRLAQNDEHLKKAAALAKSRTRRNTSDTILPDLSQMPQTLPTPSALPTQQKPPPRRIHRRRRSSYVDVSDEPKRESLMNTTSVSETSKLVRRKTYYATNGASAAGGYETVELLYGILYTPVSYIKNGRTYSWLLVDNDSVSIEHVPCIVPQEPEYRNSTAEAAFQKEKEKMSLILAKNK
ncbi:hypothetical protein B0H11DRAFT_1912183 [Mycena galericulata]|nr:hypothetical protein B0H11DRAFT_1912183 [Mycena galericulata]